MMSDKSYIGWKEIHLQLEAEQQRVDSLYARSLEEVGTSGMPGEPLPYLIRTDWSIGLLMIVCFACISLVLRNGKKYLLQHIKSFFRQRERASLFDEQAAINLQYTLLLGAVACILTGTAFYHFFVHQTPRLIDHLPSVAWIGIYALACLLLILAKRLLYAIVNGIFFDYDRRRRWADAYLDIIAFTGLALFPAMMVVVYLDLTSEHFLMTVLSILFITKIMLFYKCARNFFRLPHGSLHLFVYFCALELTPDFLLWKSLEQINDLVLINY